MRASAVQLTIVHLTAGDRPVGPGKQIIAQSVYLKALGIRPIVVDFAVRQGEIELLEAAAARGLATERLECASGWDPRAVGQLAALLRRRRAAALVTHGYKADLVGLAAARAARLPVVAFARGWTGESARVRLYELLDRWALGSADRVVAVSQAMRERLLALGLEPARVVCIPNAVDVPSPPPDKALARRRLQEAFSIDAADLLIATAGRLSPEKAQADFLRAAARIVPERPRARFLLFGDGPEERRLRTLAVELGLGERVVFCGFHRDLGELLPGLDLFVLPSLTEGLPNVILEAFAAGVPVVATSVGGVPELALEGRTMLLVPPARPSELAAALEQALTDPEAGRRRAEAARALAAEQYSFAANARRFADLLWELTPRRVDRQEAG